MKSNIYKSTAIMLLSLIIGGEAFNNTEPSDNLTSATQDCKPVLQKYFHEIVASIYKNDIGNLDKVLEFSNYSSSYQFKTDVLIGLLEIMQYATHTENPLYALKLYNAIEDVINVYGSNLPPNQLEYLIEVNNELFYKIIIPNGADVLKAAVYFNSNHYENTIVGKLVDLLHVSNETVTVSVFNEIAKSIHYVLTAKEQILRLRNFSNHLEQNIEGLLALHNVDPQFYGIVNFDFFSELKNLLEHPDYNSAAVSLSQKQRINEVFPITMQTLYGGSICLYHEMANGERLYLGECSGRQEECVNICVASYYKHVFKTNLNVNADGINFYCKHSSHRSLIIRSKEQQQIGGLNLNVWNCDPVTIVDENENSNWKIELDGDQVILQNMNSTMYLCAGSQQTQQVDNWKAYTRDAQNFALNRDECKWTVEDCPYWSD